MSRVFADGFIRRYRLLQERFEQELPASEASHRDWQQVAQRWAELVVLRWEWDQALDPSDRDSWSSLQAEVEERFGTWMLDHYGSLYNLPYHQQPVMVHQISRFMAVELTRKKISKIALLVLDGLAFDQWLLLKKNLEAAGAILHLAGTEVRPGDRKFLDYAFPPLHQPMGVVTNTGGRTGWHNWPLPGPLFPSAPQN